MVSHQRPQKPAARAFTLIEILVVVAIIALLISILLPSLSRAREQARGAACKSNLRQVGFGMQYYVTDSKRIPANQPLLTSFNGLAGGWDWNQSMTWEGRAYHNPLQVTDYSGSLFDQMVPRNGTIFRYVRAAGAYLCPSDNPGVALANIMAGGGGNGRISYTMNWLVGWKKPDQCMAMTYNSGISFSIARTDPVTNLSQNDRSVNIPAGTRVSWGGGSKMPLLMEEHPYYGYNRPGNSRADGNFGGQDRVSCRHSPPTGGGYDQLGRTNLAFLDSHVESIMYPWKHAGDEFYADYKVPFRGADRDSFVAKLR